MDASERFGLSAAMCLPLGPDGTPDAPKLVEHARRCIDGGCDGVTLFGTTGEGASLGERERDALLNAFAGSGIDLRTRLVGGVAASSVEGAAAQAATLLRADCRAVLLPPPFYFKGVDEDGTFEWYARTLERLGGAARDVILYHIPSVTAVPATVGLVTRLRERFPDVIVGVKDSSGDFANTRAMLEAHGDIAILVGDERTLAEGMRLGAQGAISGMANVCPERLARMVAEGRDDAGVAELVDAVLEHPVVPAVRVLVAHRMGDAAWLVPLPPLRMLGDAASARLCAVADRVLGG